MRSSVIMQSIVTFTLLAMLGLTASAFAQAETLVGCRLYSHGTRVTEVAPFDIVDYASDKPSARVDGNLLDFIKTEKNVTMSFSNECDNIYEITFSNEAIAKAKAGVFKTLIGKASIGTSDLDHPIVGVLKCDVLNLK